MDCRKESLKVNEQPGGRRGPPLQSRWILLRLRNLRDIPLVMSRNRRLVLGLQLVEARSAQFAPVDDETIAQRERLTATQRDSLPPRIDWILHAASGPENPSLRESGQ